MTKKRKNRMNKTQSIVLTILGVFSLTIIGGALLSTSKAAPVYMPIEAGLNFQAGWANGLHTDADNYEIIDNLAAAGMKWVRMDIGWSTIEEAGDVYGDSSDLSATYDPNVESSHWYIRKIDRAVNYARSKGIEVLGIWWTTPTWNTDGSAGGSSYTRPAGYPSYPEYAESVEWAAKYWEGRIDNWEIWNEADPVQAFWVARDGSYGGTERYAALLKAAYPAVKRGNPNANVLVSGASSVDTPWVTDLYGYGIQGYFDIMAIHTYEGLANNDPLNSSGNNIWNFLHVPTLRQLMIDNGDSDKPIWITEMGYSTHDNTDLTGDGVVKNWNLGVTEQQQGDYLVNAIDYAKNNWPYIEVFIIYNDKNRSSAGGDAETSRHQMNFGIMTVDNTPKPALGILSDYLNATSPNTSDLNNDTNVDIVDLSILLSSWGTNNTTADINSDGIVDIVDLSILLSDWS